MEARDPFELEFPQPTPENSRLESNQIHDKQPGQEKSATPDPPLMTVSASRTALTWIVTLALLITAIVMQRPEAGSAEQVRQALAGDGDIQPTLGLGDVAGRLSLALHSMSTNESDLEAIREMESMFLSFAKETATDAQLPAAERFRAILLLSKFDDNESAANALESLRGVVGKESTLRTDFATVTLLGDNESPSAEAIEGLKARHGWIGEWLVLDGDAAREFEDRSERQGMILLTVMVAGLTYVVIAFIAGVFLLVIALIKVLNGKLPLSFEPLWKSRPETKPRILWVEMFAVFLAAFILLPKLIGLLASAFAPAGATWPTTVGLLAQWATALSVLWPMVRGMPFAEFRLRIGWHTGRGVWREAAAGLGAYFAAFPLYLLIAVVVVIIMFLWQMLVGTRPLAPEQNKVMELLGHGGLGAKILLASLVVFWAPLVEETIFRGALYNSFRGAGMFLAVVLSALAFASLHGYMLVQLIMVCTLGLIFAAMREWRGSLIGSMTAHCIHNTFVFALMMVIVHALS